MKIKAGVRDFQIPKEIKGFFFYLGYSHAPNPNDSNQTQIMARIRCFDI